MLYITGFAILNRQSCYDHTRTYTVPVYVVRSRPSKQGTLNQSRLNAGPPSVTLAKDCFDVSCLAGRWYCIGRSPPPCVNKQTGVGGSLRQGTVTSYVPTQCCSNIGTTSVTTLVLASCLRRRRLWAQQTQYITVSTCWIRAGPTSKMLFQFTKDMYCCGSNIAPV